MFLTSLAPAGHSSAQAPLAQRSGPQAVSPQHSSKQAMPAQHSSKLAASAQRGSTEAVPTQHSSKQAMPAQASSAQAALAQRSGLQAVSAQHSSKQAASAQHSSTDAVPAQHSSKQAIPAQHRCPQAVSAQHSSPEVVSALSSNLLHHQAPGQSAMMKHNGGQAVIGNTSPEALRSCVQAPQSLHGLQTNSQTSMSPLNSPASSYVMQPARSSPRADQCNTSAFLAAQARLPTQAGRHHQIMTVQKSTPAAHYNTHADAAAGPSQSEVDELTNGPIRMSLGSSAVAIAAADQLTSLGRLPTSPRIGRVSILTDAALEPPIVSNSQAQLRTAMLHSIPVLSHRERAESSTQLASRSFKAHLTSGKSGAAHCNPIASFMIFFYQKNL